MCVAHEFFQTSINVRLGWEPNVSTIHNLRDYNVKSSWTSRMKSRAYLSRDSLVFHIALPGYSIYDTRGTFWLISSLLWFRRKWMLSYVRFRPHKKFGILLVYRQIAHHVWMVLRGNWNHELELFFKVVQQLASIALPSDARLSPGGIS